MEHRFWVVFSLGFFFFQCQSNQTDNFYEPFEANRLIALEFAAKDSACGTTHRLNNFLLNRAKITDVQNCLTAIRNTNCVNWNINDPTPARCRSITLQL